MNKRDSEKREDIASCLELLALFRQLLPEEQRKALELLRTLTEQAEETYSTQTDARARPGPAGGRRPAPLSRSIRSTQGAGGAPDPLHHGAGHQHPVPLPEPQISRPGPEANQRRKP